MNSNQKVNREIQQKLTNLSQECQVLHFQRPNDFLENKSTIRIKLIKGKASRVCPIRLADLLENFTKPN